MTKVLALSFFIAMCCLLIQVWFTSKSQKETAYYKVKCDSLKRASDSLMDELYPSALELNRYQMGYEIFLKRNPKAAHQYADIISDETE